MDVRADIHLLARAHQYRLHPSALAILSEHVPSFGASIEHRRSALRELFSLLHKFCEADRFVDVEKMKSAIELQLSKSRGVSEDPSSYVISLGLEDIPYVYVDERSNEIKVQPIHQGDRFTALRQRYLFARRRCLRSGLFRRDLGKQSIDRDQPPLVPSIALEGTDPSETLAVLGILIDNADGTYLEDLYGRVKLVLHRDVRYSMGMVGDGLLVVAKGQWMNGALTVASLSLPPAEKREDTLKDTGPDCDLFGRRPVDVAVAFAREKMALRSVIVVLSQIYLDQHSTVTRLASFFSEMQNRSEVELADTTIVLVGNLCSTAIHYDDVSHLPEPFEGCDRYRSLMDTLATVILAHAPNVAQYTQVVIVPGPGDATALLGVLPQPPIVSSFAKTLQTRLKRVVFAPNPCRLRFFTHEIVIARRDFSRSLRERARVFSHYSEGTATTIFDDVAKTIMDQAHLAPEVKEGILWKADGVLSLPVLPHLLVLCDSTEQWECSYKNVRVINPGSFSIGRTFLWYTPADGECSLSSIEP
ncbi:putative DNA polymerase alpha epsilon subunit B [Trypanosoma vivax]|uniref:DNA polymerase epsilon subunit n=1 Tax=Trypanosoma vivax (strain Y486) TaxID=1055687 RepID=G0U3Q7_TRYVY|nr:putative DNA polymerase epsilon subunit b [Trypanosoma vivax]KAH8613729.1 putative DNA polymerase alpha epsilon subunit B [Trypanosoma vivax]CCC50916.1 putative DNA polymerase epsilon subunit b [Trypanosoma vivax Y486]